MKTASQRKVWSLLVPKPKVSLERPKITTSLLPSFYKTSWRLMQNVSGICLKNFHFIIRFFKVVSVIDPVAIHAKWKTTLCYLVELPKCHLVELPNHVSNILLRYSFEKEYRKIFINVELPPCLVNHSPVRADHWWHSIQKDYSVLSEFRLSLLTIIRWSLIQEHL